MYSLPEIVAMNKPRMKKEEKLKLFPSKWVSGLKAKNKNIEIIDLDKLTYEERQKILEEVFKGW